MIVKIHLKKLLEDHKMSQKDLATQTGIRAASIHNMYYNQTQRIPLKHIASICTVLNCDINDLLKLEKEL